MLEKPIQLMRPIIFNVFSTPASIVSTMMEHTVCTALFVMNLSGDRKISVGMRIYLWFIMNFTFTDHVRINLLNYFNINLLTIL